MALHRRISWVYCVLAMLLAVAGPAVLAQEYNVTGPLSILYYGTPAKFVLPSHTRVEVDVTLTFPSDKQSGPYPIIVMLNGFQCQASWYADTVNHMASWGYVVMQYTVREGVSAREEVKYLTPLLEWLVTEADRNASLTGKIDFNRKAVMGHSRGGKLAGIHYATRTDLTTAVFLDPVDCGVSGYDQPSTIAKLVGLDISCGKTIPAHGRTDKSAAIIGAGFVRKGLPSKLLPPCNPPGSNYLTFFDTLSTNSWNLRLKKAGHMQFAQSNDLSYSIIDTTCGRGDITNAEVISEAKTMAVAWFESVFRPSESTNARVTAFKLGLKSQCEKGVVDYRLPNSETCGDIGKADFTAPEDEEAVKMEEQACPANQACATAAGAVV